MTAEGSIRIDKWLWAARFFKSRALASAAVAGGKVHLNQQRTKPGHLVKPGDQLTIQREDGQWLVRILELSEYRGPATIAQGLYEESEESRRQRAETVLQRQTAGTIYRTPGGRPTKRNRRVMTQIRGD